MHLLYLDDAGSPGNAADKHFILAGVAVFERQAYWLQAKLDELAAEYPDADPSEFHGSAMFGGRGRWRRVRKEHRHAMMTRALQARESIRGHCPLFGVVVDQRARSPEDPVAYAFEQLCNRFDRYLRRRYLRHRGQKMGDNQRGLIILDKSTRETQLQSLASEFKTVGHRWGATRYLADVPFFVDSRATRLIQYADLVAHAMWRKFEKGDDRFFRVIADGFDREGPAVHGLHHFKDLGDVCDCPACATGP